MKTRPLHPDFRETYRAAGSKGSLAFLVEWPAKEIGRTMNADAVRVTPLMVTRLANLARELNYTGPIFGDESCAALPTTT